MIVGVGVGVCRCVGVVACVSRFVCEVIIPCSKCS